VNRGAGTRPLSADDIRGKFLTNAGRALAPERAERVMAATLALDGFDDAREFGKVLCA
jgi:hypothetical protein